MWCPPQVVRKMGLEKMPTRLKSMLPEIDLNNERHRDRSVTTTSYSSTGTGTRVALVVTYLSVCGGCVVCPASCR